MIGFILSQEELKVLIIKERKETHLMDLRITRKDLFRRNTKYYKISKTTISKNYRNKARNLTKGEDTDHLMGGNPRSHSIS